MYLKSLALHGFKSFADKTKLEFDMGVTGVVGSNGCGKSNVVDAIRWVLGETSAKALRGGEMADVIFNGTEKRKPMGMAEVTLTMGDCEELLKVDYNEVSITRRVFRDGKSEYRINGTLCRLRDIHDLFMDTGIGRTAYSIMEQGKIDMLLSSKPEDRRLVFEEAAGITKFKKEKKEALRKLDYTQANLLRVSDVLEEQERSMNSLKRQVTRARRYQKLSAAVRVLDTHLAHRKFLQMNGLVVESQKSTRLLELRERELAEALPLREKEVIEARDKAQELERKLAEVRQVLVEKRNAASAAQSKVSFNRERQAELESRIKQNLAEMEEIRQKLSQQELDLEFASANLSEMTQQISKQESVLKQDGGRAAALKSRRLKLEAEVNSVKNSVSKTQAQIVALEVKLEGLKVQAEADSQRRKQQRTDQERLSKEHQAAQLRQEKLEVSLAEQVLSLVGLEEAMQSHERAFQKLRGDVDSARSEVSEQHRASSKKSSRLEVLEQLVASGEGMESGTRAVLDGLDDKALYGAALRGVLASFIKVDGEFAVPIETALAGQMETLIVRDAVLAEAIIGKLIEMKLGRAALVPEGFLPPAPTHQLEYLPEGGLAWARDKLSCDPLVKSLVEGLLQKVLIVENLEVALSLRPSHGDLHFVGLDGSSLRANGVMQGGSGGGAEAESSILLRQNEIESLREQVAELAKDEHTAGKRLQQRVEELAEQQELLEKSRERLQKARVEESTLKGQLSLASRDLETIEMKMSSLAKDCKEREKRELAIGQDSELLEKELCGTRGTMDLSSSQLLALDGELEGVRAEEAEAQHGFNELKTKLAVEKRAIQSARDQQYPMRARLQELNILSNKRGEEVATFKQKIIDAEVESKQLAEEIKQNTEQAEKRDKELAQMAASRPHLLEAIHIAEKKAGELRQSVSKLTEQKGKAEVESTKLELRLESLLLAMQERYQLDMDGFAPDMNALRECLSEMKSAAAGNSAAEIDWAQVEADLGHVKRKLDAMGPVNVDAIEEFEELEQRFLFVKGQYEDLTNAKDELVAVIEKINVETRKRFTETFELIRQNFKAMFQVLFGENAHADLLLVDEDDPLESGIEVIAKPPGKTLQSITLLSGGERSMTAVALLFSIYQIKPSPFCVLDELDAPLDESNIARFLNVLDQFIETSQFIIVTHSKRTMSRADVIYGITMEERGVSKPVSIRLTDC